MAQTEDRRVRRTKRLLRQAMAELMQEKDFKDITVTDLVQRADLNRGTFYVHYKDVYDLREQLENEMIAACSQFIEATAHADKNHSLHTVLTRATDYLLENRQLVCSLMRTSGDDSFSDKLIAVIEQYHQLRSTPAAHTGDYMARFIGAGAIAVIHKWLQQEESTLSQEDIVRLLDDLLRRILLPYQDMCTHA